MQSSTGLLHEKFMLLSDIQSVGLSQWLNTHQPNLKYVLMNTSSATLVVNLFCSILLKSIKTKSTKDHNQSAVKFNTYVIQHSVTNKATTTTVFCILLWRISQLCPQMTLCPAHRSPYWAAPMLIVASVIVLWSSFFSAILLNECSPEQFETIRHIKSIKVYSQNRNMKNETKSAVTTEQ